MLFNVASVLPLTDADTAPDIAAHVVRIADKLRLSPSAVEELEQATRSQSGSNQWHAEHVGRITASTAHCAMTASKSATPDCVIRDIMRYRPAAQPRAGGLRPH